MNESPAVPREGRPRRVVVGISGATGIVYAVRLLEILRLLGAETHLVVSRPADHTRALECDVSRGSLLELATYTHKIDDIGASIASGSFRVEGMVVVPCSMKTLAEIATGSGGSLLARAADVNLKERRRLILVTREAPLSLVHIRNMEVATLAGAIIFPPVTEFYTRPRTLEDVVDHTVGRLLDLLGFEPPPGLMQRWGEAHPAEPQTPEASR